MVSRQQGTGCRLRGRLAPHLLFFSPLPSHTGRNTWFPLPSPFLLTLDVLPSPFFPPLFSIPLFSGHRPSASPVPFASGHFAQGVSPPLPSHSPTVCLCTPQAPFITPTSCLGHLLRSLFSAPPLSSSMW